jgi:hypothetical protein
MGSSLFRTTKSMCRKGTEAKPATRIGGIMKNQYFGDTRDLFKYDLTLELLSRNKIVDHFCYIPMLTANENTSHGGRTNYDRVKAGTKNMELKSFLDRCVRENRRNINELKEFFRAFSIGRKIEFAVYRPNEYFCHWERAKYFADIEPDLLCNSLILIDPDVGIEVKSMKGREKGYVTFTEVKSLFSRMDKNSVLAVFQFIPRVERQSYLSKLCRKLKDAVNAPVIFISDDHIAFFIMTKDPVMQKQVVDTINGYSETYGLITGNVQA